MRACSSKSPSEAADLSENLPPYANDCVELCFEIKLDWIDKRHQPLKQRQVRRVSRVGVTGGLVGKLHQPRKGIPLSARREIGPHMRLDQPWNGSTKGQNLLRGPRLTGRGRLRLAAKSKDVNEHQPSISRLNSP